jgi:hypothetical protein
MTLLKKNLMMLQILMSVYSVDSPLVRLDAYGLQFVYPCSNTSDEVYGSLNFSELSELLTKL